jgi:hypothetical protein
MEIFNQGVTRGIRMANFASVQVFSGRLIPDGKLDTGPTNPPGPIPF